MISCIAGSLLFGIAQRANSPAPKGAGLSLCSDLNRLCRFGVGTVKRKLQSKGFHSLSYLLLTDHSSSALIKFKKASMFILQL